MPSTTNSFPGYVCDVIRLFSMISSTFLVVGARYLEAQRTPEDRFERRHMAVRGPEFELRVPGRTEPYQVIVGARINLDPRERLRVAAIEPFREPDDRCQRFHHLAQRSAEVAVPVMGFLRRRLPVIARDERDDLDLLRIESS